MGVRAARPGDEAALARIRVRGWQVGYDGLVGASHLDAMSVEADTAMWSSLLPAQVGLRRTLVVESGTQASPRIAGFCSLGPYRSFALDDHGAHTEVVELAEPGTVGEVYAFYVDPDLWGAGSADELMRATVAALGQDGWPLARLWVLAGNARALRFYARYAWLPDGARQTLPLPGRPVEIRLQRALP